MSLELVPLPPDKIEESRNLWLPFVAAIARREGSYLEQKLGEVYSGNVGIILVWDTETKSARALFGYSIVIRGKQRIFWLKWVTGRDAAGWIDLYDKLEAAFRANGCTGMAATARPGWSKFLRGKGYKLKHMEYEKCLV